MVKFDKRLLVITCILIFISLNSVFAADGVGETPTSLDSVSSKITLYTKDTLVATEQHLEILPTSYNETSISYQENVIDVNPMNYTTKTNGSSFVLLSKNPDYENYIADNGLINNLNFVKSSNTFFIAENLNNAEIQNIIDSVEKDTNIEFLGKVYNNIALTITNNPVNLVSNCGTILNGVNGKPLILISGTGTSGTKIIGLNLVAESTGIEINNVNNVKIINNTISNFKNGILSDGSLYINIENNKLTNINNNAIYLKNTLNSNIIGNALKDNTNGIYYDVGNQNINIHNNTITGSSEYGINLDKSGSYSSIQGNIIDHNQNGIFVNCNAEELKIEYNTIKNNEENGINIGADYQQTSNGKDFTLLGNVITNNTHFNILAKDSNYPIINLAGNWVGTDNPSFVKVDSKIKMPFYLLKVEQINSRNFIISIGPNGIPDPLLPPVTVLVSFNGGKTWVAVLVVNGQAMVHVPSGSYNNIIIRDFGPDLIFSLKHFVPYSPTVYPYNSQISFIPTINEIQDDIKMNKTVENNSSKSGSHESSEEIVVVGTGAIIVLLFFIIAAYYRKDIEDMINNKKGK